MLSRTASARASASASLDAITQSRMQKALMGAIVLLSAASAQKRSFSDSYMDHMYWCHPYLYKWISSRPARLLGSLQMRT